MGGGSALNRKLLFYSLEQVKYLNNAVDILNSAGESEGFLEGFSSPFISRFFIAKKFSRRERLGGLWASSFDSFICSARQRIRLIIMFSREV